jgi:aspartyl-tRNA(Asn)/glutamyl-tRNA(Gln) amidotransferase subunit A
MIIGKREEDCAKQIGRRRFRDACTKKDKMAGKPMPLRTIAETSELVRDGRVSPLELLRECIDRITRLNPTLNTFITVTADSALAEAKQAEKEIQSGNWRGPLHGIPIGLKDLIDTAGVRTTAASAVFANRVPPEDAEVVTRLKAAGAVLVGKQNLHEFAYGGSSLISHFGVMRNPVNPEFIAGGSSGGSAAAVALGMCYGAIGTDTAGSIREPAALCGVVGFKPSYGLVSTHGIIPLSVSLDHAGPLARSVEDAAILLDAITGPDGQYRNRLREGMDKLGIGIPRKFFFDDLDAEVVRAMEEAIRGLERMGSKIHEIELAVDTDRTVQAAESYAYHREMVTRSAELYDPETLRRIRSGEKITDDQYQNALRELKKIRAEIPLTFRDVDFLLTPTTPIPAPRISDLTQDPALLRPAEVVLLRNTRPVNVWGLPAISVPCGTTKAGLPIGLQIVGPPDGDLRVLQAALKYEQINKSA